MPQLHSTAERPGGGKVGLCFGPSTRLAASKRLVLFSRDTFQALRRPIQKTIGDRQKYMVWLRGGGHLKWPFSRIYTLVVRLRRLNDRSRTTHWKVWACGS